MSDWPEVTIRSCSRAAKLMNKKQFDSDVGNGHEELTTCSQGQDLALIRGSTIEAIQTIQTIQTAGFDCGCSILGGDGTRAWH